MLKTEDFEARRELSEHRRNSNGHAGKQLHLDPKLEREHV